MLSSEDGRRVEPFDFDYALNSSCDPKLKKFASQERVYSQLGEDVVEAGCGGRGKRGHVGVLPNLIGKVLHHVRPPGPGAGQGAART